MNKKINLIQPTINIMPSKGDNIYSKLNPIDFSMIKLLNGQNDITEIFGELLIQKYDVEEIMTSFKQLFELNIIKENPDSILGVFSEKDLESFKSQLLLFEYLSTNEKMIFQPFSERALLAQKRIKDSNILLMVGISSSKKLNHSLSNVGFENITTYELNKSNLKTKENQDNLIAIFNNIDENVDLVVYCPDSFSEETALKLNKACFDKEINFITYRVYQTSFEVGPINIPNETSCYQCFISRRQGAIAPYLSRENKNSVKLPELMDYNEFGFQLLIIEIVRLISEITPPLTIDKVWFFDWLTGRSELNEVYKVPRCSLCGINRIHPEQKIWEQI